MSGAFFRDLNLAEPDVWLGVGSGSHATQTAEVMKAFEGVLVAEQPDVVLVVGDVNSTVGCALVTAKMTSDDTHRRPLLGHVESGLRSFDRMMPEETNRIVTDHLADLLFVTEESGLRNLRSDGVPDDKIHFVGNTMIDSLVTYQDRAEASTILEELDLRRNGIGSIVDYVLVTLHRPGNVDNAESLAAILGGLEEIALDCRVVFPVHPRTRSRLQEFGWGCGERPEHRGHSITKSPLASTILIDPLGYLDFVCLMKHAQLVVTDSGGIQEETTCLGVPCVTARENTERPVTVNSATNVVAGTTTAGISAAVKKQRLRERVALIPDKWDGRAATRIVETLVRLGRSSGASVES